jgi:hypothetical protein
MLGQEYGIARLNPIPFLYLPYTPYQFQDLVQDLEQFFDPLGQFIDYVLYTSFNRFAVTKGIVGILFTFRVFVPVSIRVTAVVILDLSGQESKAL